MDEKEKWLIDYLTNEQEGNVTDPVCTQSEMEARLAMAAQFDITVDWAYECIKKFVERNPNLHLEKVTVVGGIRLNKKWREKELTYIEQKS